jgi:eukaryotic-like serine/threonine-protein kinase
VVIGEESRTEGLVVASSCPAPEALRRFALDDPAPEEADSLGPLAVHLEECTSCRDALEQFARLTAGDIGPVNVPVAAPTVSGYEIIEEIGRGGAGVVYRARQESPSRPVALKFLPGGLLAGPSWRERALREASAAARVRHPNVLPVHEVGEADGFPYLVMDLIEGGTLARRLSDGPLAPKAAAEVIETVARAVGHMQRRNVLHLDLKPANILLDGPPDAPVDRCVPLVADFGIARILDEPGATALTVFGTLGTPGYMAPEQAGASGKGRPVDKAADIYSLGAILYHCLTGHPPFQATTAVEALVLVRDSAPGPSPQLPPRLPRDLEAVAMKCLEKSPARRYATADDLADDLRRWLDGHPVRARRVLKAEHAWRWCRRHPAVASLVAALALTVISGVTGLLVLLDRAETERGRAAAEHAQAKVERERASESRHRAEEYEQFSARAAEELVGLVGVAMHNPWAPSQDEVVASVVKLRESASNLGQRGPVWSSMVNLNLHVIWGLLSRGKTEDARKLLKSTINDLKTSLQEDPNNRRVQLELATALLHSVDAAVAEGRFEEAVEFCEQAVELQLQWRSDWNTSNGLKDIYTRFADISDFMIFGGQPERAERASNSCKRILDRLKTTVREDPNNRHAQQCLQQCLALFLGHNLFSPSHPDDPEARAVAIVSAIRERCSAPGLGEEVVTTTGIALPSLLDKATRTAAYQRKIGRIDDARRTAGMLMAIARRLVLEFPDRADSYIVLSEAYTQVAKNAWKDEDFNTIERSWGQALEAVRRAVELDPGREDARRIAATLAERLTSLKAGREQGKSAAR